MMSCFYPQLLFLLSLALYNDVLWLCEDKYHSIRLHFERWLRTRLTMEYFGLLQEPL